MERLLQEAIQLASHVHEKQLDKTGMPFIGHPMRVMCMCETFEQKIIGVLHDVVEDGNVKLAYLRLVFGDTIADAIDAISHRPGEHPVRYLRRVKLNELALYVKKKDIKDNTDPKRMRQLDEATQIRLGIKYKAALDELTC